MTRPREHRTPVTRRLRRFRRHLSRRTAAPLMVITGTFLLLVVVSAAFVAARAVLAERHLTQARAEVVALRADLRGPDAAVTSDRDAHALARSARAAHGDVSDPVWGVWQHFPVLGRGLRTARGLATAVDAVSAQVVPTLVTEATSLPQMRESNGAINVALLADQAPALARASAAITRINAAVSALPGTVIGPLNHARGVFAGQLNEVATDLSAASIAASTGPAMLGVDGARHYLLVVQNNAEARADGGIVGAYGLLTADDGKLSLSNVGADTSLTASPSPVADFGSAFTLRYAHLGATQDWREATLTPDFPTAAKVMLGLFHYDDPTLATLDGVLSIDAVTLADVLSATGPVSADGRELTATNTVPFLLSQAYALYPTKADRSTVLTSAAQAIFDQVSAGAAPTTSLIRALGSAVSTGHLQLFSNHVADESALRRTSLSGSLPATASPLLMVETQDAGGSKLAYYLRRTVTYQGSLDPDLVNVGAGLQAQEDGTVTVSLTNTAPASGLPKYVTQRVDLAGGVADPVGQAKYYVSIYVAHNGVLTAATLDGNIIPMASQTEQGLAIFSTTLTLNPGQTRSLVLHVQQPTSPGQPLVYREQPVVVPDILHLTESADGHRLDPVVQ